MILFSYLYCQNDIHPQVGLGSALRLNALAHVADPWIRRDVKVQQLAMEVALRFQHLAAGWLIYAYNGNLAPQKKEWIMKPFKGGGPGEFLGKIAKFGGNLISGGWFVWRYWLGKEIWTYLVIVSLTKWGVRMLIPSVAIKINIYEKVLGKNEVFFLGWGPGIHSLVCG